MKTFTILALALGTALLPAQTKPAAKPVPNLQAILAQLDTASKTFKNAQASVQYDNYTRAVRAHDLQTGTIYIEHTGKGSEMGAAVYEAGPDGKPARAPSKVLGYDGGTLQVYTPGDNQVDVFKAGGHQAKYESFLTLGFGGSGTDLTSSWNIKDDGTETIDGVATEKLELTSKDPSVGNLFKLVTIWIDPVRGVSLKQVFLAPNNDSRTATYTNIKLNTRKIDKAPYSISKSAKRIQH